MLHKYLFVCLFDVMAKKNQHLLTKDLTLPNAITLCHVSFTNISYVCISLN